MCDNKLFPDGKTFPDCAPKMDPLDVLIATVGPDATVIFDLRRFVENHFWLPETIQRGMSLARAAQEHIDQLCGRY